MLYEIAKGKAIRVEHVRAMAQEVIGSPDVRDKEVFFNCKACITKTLVSCLGKNVFSLAAEMEEKGSLDRGESLQAWFLVVNNIWLVADLRQVNFVIVWNLLTKLGKQSISLSRQQK